MDNAIRPRRPRNRIDLTGQVFGELTARVRLPKEPGTQGEKWLCECSCGRTTNVRVKDLSHHNTKSCGHLTGRPRVAPDQPHKAADLFPEIEAAVHAALRDGRDIPRSGLRAQYRGKLSHGTYYRFVLKAQESFAARPQAE
jgi:hypothetical protein